MQIYWTPETNKYTMQNILRDSINL